MKGNVSQDSYISNYECDIPFCSNVFREHKLKELHEGCGGSGKTHKNIYDNGLIKKIFIAPSWKLSREKNLECGIPNNVTANILISDPEKISYILENYNVLIIDEVSMMTNEAKEIIFETFSALKIIMCGDIGYQAKPFSTDGSPVEVCNKNGFDNIVTYTINRRCKCERLQGLLDMCREMIDNKFLYENMKKAIKQKITKEELKKKYTKKDMILCRTHKRKDEYTEMFKDVEKYYMLTTDRKYCKGEIVFEKPDTQYYKEGTDYELRHAYTVHAIQGETAKYNLYIDNKHIEPEIVYTALSRASYLSQIYIVV